MSSNQNSCRQVALVGSSGGGTATLGHTQPSEFVSTISEELEKIGEPGVKLSVAIFVSLNDGKGMDHVDENDGAKLFHLASGIQRVHQGTLREINQRVSELEAELADKIERDEMHGLISVSCKPSLFEKTFKAAAKKDVPVTGTGGTSLSVASSEFRIRLVGNAGGSVATTPLTKAISFSHALAQCWNVEYNPWTPTGGMQKQGPSWQSVLNSCLPVFWAVMLCKRFLQSAMANQILQHTEDLIHFVENYALPTACAVIMAQSYRSSPSVLMGSVLAASACRRSILGGLLAGWLVPFIEERLLYFCILYGNVPATMTNLITSGLVGILVALFVSPLTSNLSWATEIFRSSLTFALSDSLPEEYKYIRILGMGILGPIFCYGSKVGWYHSIFLPAILVEMELGDPSILGAIDQLTLVLVSAGICSGIWLVGPTGDTALVKRGVLINLLCGDFIEACYPFMEQSAMINIGGYLASACSVAILVDGCKSSAYLPSPLAIWLAEDRKLFLFASAIAMGISFLATVLHFLVTGRRKAPAEKVE